MLNTSKDVLYIVLAASTGVLTIFLCWAIYYLVRILRNGVYMVEKVTDVVHKADEVVDMAKEKLESTGTYLAVVANFARGAMEYFGERAVSLPKKAKKRASRKK